MIEGSCDICGTTWTASEEILACPTCRERAGGSIPCDAWDSRCQQYKLRIENLAETLRDLERTLSERDHQYLEAELLLRRVLDDENFGIGLLENIRSFLGFPAAKAGVT